MSSSGVSAFNTTMKEESLTGEWDVWLPMLPQLQHVPWTLQDISKILRLGRAREKFSALSPQAIERVSALLQRPLLRIVRETKRLSQKFCRCSKHEMQTSVRLVLSLPTARTCSMLANKALSLYTASLESQKYCRSKRARSGLVFSVGKIFRWLVSMKVAARVYDSAAIYLAATLEYIAEEIAYRSVTRFDKVDQLTPEVLEKWINCDADMWGMFQPYHHLLSGRTASGISNSLSLYGASAKEQARQSPRPLRESLEPSILTTCVSSVTELAEKLSHAQRYFRDYYQSKENRTLSSVSWTPAAVNTLFYYMKCSHNVDEDISDILCATRRAHSHLPPLVEWLRVTSLHAEHRLCGAVDDDDVRQAARLLMPFIDCEPRTLKPDQSLSSSTTLDEVASATSFQQDLGLRMLLSGRRDIVPHALAMIGVDKVNTIDCQGITPLMYACVQDDHKLVKLLIEHHALLDTQVPKTSPSHPFIIQGIKSWSALHFAAVNGHVYVCQILLDAGANPDGPAVHYGQDNFIETPLQLAAGSGHYELVSLLLRRGADPYINLANAALSAGQSGFGNAFAAAAAHGHRHILRKLLSEPPPRRESDMMSLQEILEEGSSSNKDGNRKLSKARIKALQEAMYHSCEHGYLDITMELRSLGVPWNLHCWTNTLYLAYEKNDKSFMRCLFRDFQSIPDTEYTSDFCDDGLIILFNILKECEDLQLSKDIALVLSTCFGNEPLQNIGDSPAPPASIKIGPEYVNNPEMSDVTFMVEGKPFYAHKIILATASKRFKSMLSHKTEMKLPAIEVKDMKYETFRLVVRYLYSGKADDAESHEKIIELMNAANYFMLDGLQKHCERLCAKRLDCRNAVTTYKYAKMYAANNLATYCEGFFLLNLPAMMEVKVFRDLVLSHSKQATDILLLLQKCLTQRIKTRTSSSPRLRKGYSTKK